MTKYHFPNLPDRDDRERAFYDFVNERRRIYRARANGAASPWTSDPALSCYRFTNVEREHDRGTRWLLGQLQGVSSLEERILQVVAYRCAQSARTVFDAVGHLPRLTDDLLLYWSDWYASWQGLRPLPIPYSAPSNPMTGHLVDALYPITEQYRDAVGGGLARRVAGRSLREVFDELENVSTGTRRFFAYQCALDLVHARDARDPDDWACIGPGTMPPLNWITLGPGYMDEQYEHAGLATVTALDLLRQDQGGHNHGARLTLHHAEHALCEFRKYCVALEWLKNQHRPSHATALRTYP